MANSPAVAQAYLNFAQALAGGSLPAPLREQISALDDAVQDSPLRILDHLPQFERRSRFVSWAMSITIRVAMTELRRRRRRDVSLDEPAREDDFVHERAVDSSLRPDEQAEREDILEAMRRTGLER